MPYDTPLNPPSVSYRAGSARGDFETEVIAFHGWGFDRRCWQFWQEQFAQWGSKFQVFDRGYFGNLFEPRFTHSDSTKIILVHSYGLHLCPIELLQQANILIAFNSFLSFHPESRVERRRSQLVLQQMIRQFEQTPETVLEDFYIQSDYLQPQPNLRPIDYQLLLKDLNQLNNSKLDQSCLKSIDKVIIFHSTNDRIVAAAQTQEFLTVLPHSCQLFSILNAGHALPFTHASECWAMIQSVFLPATS